MEVYGKVLNEALLKSRVKDAQGNIYKLQGGIAKDAILKIQQLIRENNCKNTLEVGMAMGMSTLAILYALEKNGGGKHIAIDPYQKKEIDYYDPTTPPPTSDGYGGTGIAMVEDAGLSSMFKHIDEPNYLALPKLVKDGKRFDLIFIDGYHTFDYAFIDFFYSDLLLNEGGVLVFDDVSLPMVHKVCWFLETHKSYKKIGPEMTHPLNPIYRLKTRIQRILGMRGPRNSHKEWGSIMAYKKVKTTMVRPLYFHTDFYPYFNIWWLLKKLRSIFPGLLLGRKFPKKPPPFEDKI